MVQLCLVGSDIQVLIEIDILTLRLSMMETGEMEEVEDLVVQIKCIDRWKRKVRKGGSGPVEGLREMRLIRFSGVLESL